MLFITNLNYIILGLDICSRMLPNYGTLVHFTKLMDSIEQEGRSLCALVAPHHNLEMPFGAFLYALYNHTQAITAVVNYRQTGVISVSNRLVYNNMEIFGEIMTDTKPKSMREGDTFAYLTVIRNRNDEHKDRYDRYCSKDHLVYGVLRK